MTESDQPGMDQLLPLVYDELHRLAQRYLIHERAGHTLQATALVHEAYLRLAETDDLRFENRSHLVGFAARAMRQVLVNHAKSRRALKRGGGKKPIALDDAVAMFEERAIDLVALDEALSQLAEIDSRQARVVELRFFGGLTAEEAGDVLDISVSTVERDWGAAKAWLHRAITSQ